MKFIKGNYKVEWDWIGEGFNGDYDPHNKDDKPLLRFYCSKRFGRQWEEIWETSHCTQVVRGTPREALEKLSEPIFKALEGNEILDVGGDGPEFEASRSLIRELEKLSWMGENVNVGNH